MQGSNLRLRVVVRRHELPEVRVVFIVKLENDPTIANFLEQVNDLIPLESNDWGLEDYAVELRDAQGRGFDCMHFQQVSTVFKDDEEVFIRPLVTEDRKKRRLSGRHQISTDGKHLIDGIAFGRPRLKAPRDRPPIDIPPLKRRRITYHDEEPDTDPDSETEDSPLLITEHGEQLQDANSVRVTAAFDNLDDVGFGDDDDGDDEEDDDFVGGEADEADEADEELDNIDQDELDDELRALRRDNAQVEDEYAEQEQQPGQFPEGQRRGEAARADNLDLLTLDKIAGLRAAFPTAPVDDCEKVLLESDKNETKAHKKLSRKHPAHMSVRGMLEHIDRLHSVPPTNLNDDDVDIDDEANDAESVDSFTKHYDQHGFPPGSILAGTAPTHMAETLRQSGQLVRLPVHTRFDDDGADEMDLEPSSKRDNFRQKSLDKMDSEATSSEEAESSSESEPGQSSDDEETNDSDSSEDSDSDSGSDSDSDNSSDSDSGPEVASSRDIPEPRGGVKISSTSEDKVDSDSENDDDFDLDDERSSSSSDDSSDSESDSDSDDANEDGANGDSARDRPQGNDSDSIGPESDSEPARSLGPEPETTSQLPSAAKSRNAASTNLEEPSPSAIPNGLSLDFVAAAGTGSPVPPGQGKTATQRRNARRRAKAKAKKAEASARAEAEIAAKKVALLNQITDVDDPNSNGSVNPENMGPVAAEGSDEATSPSSQRKTKDDLDAGRRTLFGALGLKNPKTKADEDNIRFSLMKDVWVPTNARHDGQGDDVQVAVSSDHRADGQEDPEAWREKVAYRAVECCERGVVLSEPPFPFVQRWDPQQRGQSKRKQRNHEDFYDSESRPSAKKRKHNHGYDDRYAGDESYVSYWGETEGADVTLNYDDEEVPANQDTVESYNEEDIPPLPSDLSVFPLLQPGELRPGIVLVWKQLLLSKATNWQPELSILAGTVESYHDESVRIHLANGYRNLDRNDKIYDDDGNRVYDKFELPGMDDEMEEGAELGYRTLALADMIETRVLQRTAEVSATPQNQQGTRESIAPQDSKPCSDYSTSLNLEASQNPQCKTSQTDMSTQQSSVSVIPDSIIPETTTTHDESQAAQHRIADIQASDDIPALDDYQASDDMQVTEDARVEDPQTEGVQAAKDVHTTEDISMSEDRREEISLLIKDAGFRKDIDPSITEDVPDLSSPSRQLEEMMAQQAAALPRHSPEPRDLPKAQESPKPRNSGTELSPEPAPSVRNGDPQGAAKFSQYVESQPSLLDRFSDDTDVPSAQLPQVCYPKLHVPPSDSSVRSGRQPDPDFSIELGDDDHFDDFVEQSHEPAAEESRPRDQTPAELPRQDEIGSAVSNASTGSSNSFPEISEISSSRLTQSTSNSTVTRTKKAAFLAIKAQKFEVTTDLKYEETMRYLNEDDASEQGEYSYRVKEEGASQTRRLSSVAQRLVGKPIEKPVVKKAQSRVAIKAEKDIREAPPPRPRVPRSRRSTQNSFSIPEGSQVVSLVSSSPEPEVVEDYADDSIDETYEEPDMATGPGWVSKRFGSRRGASVPAASIPRGRAPKPISASQGRQSVGPSVRPKKTLIRGYC